MSDAYVPEPDTHHPFYSESVVNSVRKYMGARGKGPKVVGTAWSPSEEVRVITLELRRYAALAPFVGDPMWENGVYWWYVAVDKLGRHISGSATLHIYPEPYLMRP